MNFIPDLPECTFAPMNLPFTTIIFDLGGVIVNIDYHDTVLAFHDLGFTGFDQHFSFHQQMDVFDQYEMGLISSAEFRSRLNRQFNRSLPDAEFDRAWYTMVKDIPPYRIDLIRKVKSRYQTFLLSNTNESHIRLFNEYVHSSFGLKDLSDLFHKMYYSYEVHLRKPDVAIYRNVLEENGLDPQKTLFMDDNPANVAGSRLAGIPTIHMTGGLELSDVFDVETGQLKPVVMDLVQQ